MLLVHHEEAEVAEGDVLGQEPMGADDDVHRTRLEPFHHRFLLPGATEAGQQPTRVGNGKKRSLKVWKCCWASTVVGTRTATCRPSATALKAARRATSVLP